jgi:acetyl-CoA synthetase
LYYAVTGPLVLGHSTVFFDGAFSAERAIDVIRRLGVTNLAGSPSAYRIIIASGTEAVAPIRGQLRVVSSAGEPLTPEIIRWFARHLEVTVHDHYGQTELGMVVANHHALDHPVHMGAAGLPVPGHRVVVLDDSGHELGPGEQGILAVDRKRSPLFWFAGYREKPVQDEPYYLTGDTVEWNSDGSISFVGRADDVITSAGYRIGPFDVESALAEHPAVLESAVIGKPDPERTEIVKAFVVLKSGHSASAELAEELKQLVRSRLSAHAYPREIDFMAELPKTPSGKIQRFLLRKRETGSAAADHSST